MNELAHADQFHAALSHYKLSPAALQTLEHTNLVLLIAASSSGRNTIIRNLVTTGDYYYVISDTTRKPRVNDGVLEQNGVEYWFRSEDEVLADIEAGKYLEAAVIHNQQVSGTSIRELQAATDAHKIAITDAEIKGAANAMKRKPDTTAIFVLPSSFENWQRWIKKRGPMEASEYRRRMESAAKEFETALKRDYYKFVINDNVERASERINQIAKQGVVDASIQLRGRDLAQQLLDKTQLLLTRL